MRTQSKRTQSARLKKIFDALRIRIRLVRLQLIQDLSLTHTGLDWIRHSAPLTGLGYDVIQKKRKQRNLTGRRKPL